MCPSYPQNKYKNRGPVKNKLIQSDLAAPEISYSVIKLQFLYLSITCICFKPLVSYFLVFFCKYLYNMSDQTNAVIVSIATLVRDATTFCHTVNILYFISTFTFTSFIFIEILNTLFITLPIYHHPPTAAIFNLVQPAIKYNFTFIRNR